jgi:hypothetical protein
MKATRKRILALALASTATLTQMTVADDETENECFRALVNACLTPRNLEAQQQAAADQDAQGLARRFVCSTESWLSDPQLGPLMALANSGLRAFPRATADFLLAMRRLLIPLLDLKYQQDATIMTDPQGEEMVGLLDAAGRAAQEALQAEQYLTHSVRRRFWHLHLVASAARKAVCVVYPNCPAQEQTQFLAAALQEARPLGEYNVDLRTALIPMPPQGEREVKRAAYGLLQELSTVNLDVSAFLYVKQSVINDEFDRAEKLGLLQPKVPDITRATETAPEPTPTERHCVVC